MAFSEDFIYQLRMGNPIETVISSYTNIIRRGRNYVCVCPFHSEKTPSCTIYPDTQSYYCFGCGAGGDVITFVKNIENLSYIETVTQLAERAGITLPNYDKSDDTARIKARVLEINRATANFYYANLRSPEGKKGLEYIVSRVLLPETLKKYAIGYASNDWANLYNHLSAKGFSDEELIVAGVCLRTKKGNIIDSFRNRVMFPIVDLRGNVIAFGGRLIDGDGPKYLNSPDTPVFKKSRNLFSLNFAKNSDSKRLILAEGYMDVIAINQAGIENVVATLGTALTSEQSRLISSYAKEVIIAYDSDEAGQKATHKAINLLAEVGVTTKILELRGAKDPDEFLKRFGTPSFRNLIEKADGAINFELDKCKLGLDINAETGKAEYLRRASKVLAQIFSPIERNIYISKVCKECDFSINILSDQVKSLQRKQATVEKSKDWQKIKSISYVRDEVNPQSTDHLKESRAEEHIIAYLLLHQDKVQMLENELPSEMFVTEFHRKVYEKLLNTLKNSLNFSLSLISDEFSASEMGRISGIQAKYYDLQINESVLNDCIKVLNKYAEQNCSNSTEISDDEFEEFRRMQKNMKK